MNLTHVPPVTDAESATFHDILPKIRGLIARSLLDDAAWDRLLDRAGDLPAWWTGSYFGFEFRLGDITPVADFFVGMLLNRPLVWEYIRRGEATKPSSAEASFARFLAESSRANAPWSDLFSSVGLECDIAEVPRGRRPAPGVFLKLREVPQTDRGRVPGLVAEAIAEAVGWRSDEGERRVLERVFAALPPGGEVGYVGSLARSLDAGDPGDRSGDLGAGPVGVLRAASVAGTGRSRGRGLIRVAGCIAAFPRRV